MVWFVFFLFFVLIRLFCFFFFVLLCLLWFLLLVLLLFYEHSNPIFIYCPLRILWYDNLGGFWEKGFKGIRPYILGKSMEEIVVKKCSRCKRREVAENYKQCASCLEYSRNYAKEHPDFKRELTKNWQERNADRMKEYRNEKVECPYCKQGVFKTIFLET